MTPPPAALPASATTGSFPGVTAAPELDASEFQAVRELLYKLAGISLPEGKEGLVRSRLASRLRTLALPNITAYLEYVEKDRSGAERTHFIDVLTTNKTSFFREAEHFRFLESKVLPQLAARTGPIRIWSAGCSSGEEPYTLAMQLRETLPADRLRETKILATDISTRILAKAKAAVYAADSVGDLPVGWAQRHFVRTDADTSGPRLKVVDATRALVTTARLNLMAQWPMKGPFDVILCRNVMIYFDRPTQERLVRRYAELLAPGGYLLVGHSESLTSLDHGLRYTQPAVYQK
jgi:chemotaxis protein methyltransferase CheR